MLKLSKATADHRDVTRRVPPIVCTIVALALLTSAAAFATGTGQTATLDASVLVQLNQIRVAHQLVPLVLSRQLDESAQAHSNEMIAKGYFAHASSDGSPFWKRIQRDYSSAHSSYWSVGENLFSTSGSLDVATAVSAWMASPGHRANILDPKWRQIGIGATSSADAPGDYAGLPTTVLTADFGVRRY